MNGVGLMDWDRNIKKHEQERGRGSKRAKGSREGRERCTSQETKNWIGYLSQGKGYERRGTKGWRCKGKKGLSEQYFVILKREVKPIRQAEMLKNPCKTTIFSLPSLAYSVNSNAASVYATQAQCMRLELHFESLSVLIVVSEVFMTPQRHQERGAHLHIQVHECTAAKSYAHTPLTAFIY